MGNCCPYGGGISVATRSQTPSLTPRVSPRNPPSYIASSSSQQRRHGLVYSSGNSPSYDGVQIVKRPDTSPRMRGKMPNALQLLQQQQLQQMERSRQPPPTLVLTVSPPPADDGILKNQPQPSPPVPVQIVIAPPLATATPPTYPIVPEAVLPQLPKPHALRRSASQPAFLHSQCLQEQQKQQKQEKEMSEHSGTSSDYVNQGAIHQPHQPLQLAQQSPHSRNTPVSKRSSCNKTPHSHVSGSSRRSSRTTSTTTYGQHHYLTPMQTQVLGRRHIPVPVLHLQVPQFSGSKSVR